MIFGSTAAFATGVIANRTTSMVFVDGREVNFEAYNINGYNYFKLRDIGTAVGFSVEWIDAYNAIFIETGKPQVQEIVRSVQSMDEMKAEIVRLTNIEREKNGVPKLEILPSLMDTAQLKADDMFVNDYYGHNSPVYGTAGELIKSQIPNVKSGAENLAAWNKTPQEAFASWLDSPAHYAIMINAKYTHIGVGVVEGAGGGYWWVSHFISL
jgi:uncharacterized protein YkwD